MWHIGVEAAATWLVLQGGVDRDWWMVVAVSSVGGCSFTTEDSPAIDQPPPPANT